MNWLIMSSMIKKNEFWITSWKAYLVSVSLLCYQSKMISLWIYLKKSTSFNYIQKKFEESPYLQDVISQTLENARKLTCTPSTLVQYGYHWYFSYKPFNVSDLSILYQNRFSESWDVPRSQEFLLLVVVSR